MEREELKLGRDHNYDQSTVLHGTFLQHRIKIGTVKLVHLLDEFEFDEHECAKYGNLVQALENCAEKEEQEIKAGISAKQAKRTRLLEEAGFVRVKEIFDV